MSLDKLVDSAALDDALDYTADRIRVKGGTSAMIPFDLANGTGFGDAVDAIPSGGGGDTLTVKGFHAGDLYWEQGYPIKYKVECGYLKTLNFKSGDIEGLKNIEELEVVGGSSSNGLIFAFEGRANAVHEIKKINLNFIPLKNIYTMTFIYGANKGPYFEDFLGLNFIKVGGANYTIGTFNNLGALKNITCKPNTLGQLDMVASNRNWWSLSASSLLTDASLCQIANALCATYTSTLTLHATPKARCSTLMGTVSQVTDDTGTYDFFTADANGTVSLADFITNTKGWTLA